VLPTDNTIDNEDQPQEGEAPARGSSKLVLWLIICGLGVLFLPLYIISTTVKTTNEELTTELADIEATLSATPPVPAELQTLSAEFANTQLQSQTVGSINSTLQDSYINWPTVMAALGAYDLGQMSLTSITQIDNGMRLTGRATREIVAMAYADMLRSSGLFDNVAVESITLQSIFVTATPAPTTVAPTLDPTLQTTADSRVQPTVALIPTIELKMTDFIISVTMKKATVNDGRST